MHTAVSSQPVAWRRFPYRAAAVVRLQRLVFWEPPGAGQRRRQVPRYIFLYPLETMGAPPERISGHGLAQHLEVRTGRWVWVGRPLSAAAPAVNQQGAIPVCGRG